MAWYILQTAVRQESSHMAALERALAGLPCRVFLPRCVCVRRYEGDWHTEQRLLFPGYLFVDGTEADADALKKRLVRLSGIEPASVGGVFPMQPAEQQFLQGLMSPAHVVGFSVGDLLGDRLVIESGPLMDCTDRVRRIDRHKRTAEVEYRLWGEARRMRVGLEIRRKEPSLFDGA